MTSVFISYNWAQKDYAEKIDNEISSYAEVIRDKTNVKSGDNLAEFMQRIRSADFALLLISDEYLKSINGMYEVSQLVKDENWTSKVFYKIFGNAEKIYDVMSRGEYLTYWQTKRKQMESTIVPPYVDQRDVVEELKRISDIIACIGDFFKEVSAKLRPTSDDEVVEEILKRIKPEQPTPEPIIQKIRYDILIVENDITQLDLLKQTIYKITNDSNWYQVSVETAATLYRALSLAEEHWFDVLILDLAVPYTPSSDIYMPDFIDQLRDQIRQFNRRAFIIVYSNVLEEHLPKMKGDVRWEGTVYFDKQQTNNEKLAKYIKDYFDCNARKKAGQSRF